jgi:hypothetical protein
MIRNEPDAAALVRLVAGILETDLARDPSALSRYDRLLMAAALTLAARELDNGDAPFTEALAALQPLLPDPPIDRAQGEGLEWVLAHLSRQLVTEIREGKRDGDAPTYEGLRRATRSYLAESNPKVLAR